MSFFLLPIGVLNGFGGLAGAAWLAFLGEWKLVSLGILAVIIAPGTINIAFLPVNIIVGLPGTALLAKGYTVLAFPFVLLNLFYMHAVITVWCVATLIVATHGASTEDLWPRALLAYGAAIAPLQYFVALDERNAGGSGPWQWFTLLVAQVAYIAMGLLILLGGWSVVDASIVFAALMLVAVIVTTFLSMCEAANLAAAAARLDGLLKKPQI